jgi:glycerol kinase
LGAALLAGLQVGIYSEPGELKHRLGIDRVFEPQRSPDWAQSLMHQWEKAVERSG